VPTLRASLISGNQTGLDRVADRHGSEAFDAIQAREEISQLLGQLSADERNVIARQFGLRETLPDSTDSAGPAGGGDLTPQKRRRIENAALDRLRQIVGVAR